MVRLTGRTRHGPKWVDWAVKHQLNQKHNYFSSDYIALFSILRKQTWKLTEKNDLKMKDGCLDYNEETQLITLMECSEKPSQKWQEKVIHFLFG